MENTSNQDLLKVKNLSFSYNEKALLRRIKFNLKQGEIIGLAGESGSGKTTLLKLLSGFLDPVSGTIEYKGDLVAGPADQLIPGHDSIKLMNQDFDLMPFISVDENIIRHSLSSSKSKRKKLLGHYHNRLRLGRQKNQRANETSGGQKQRIALASTMATKPELLLLDEPFSNLDFNLKNEIIDLLLHDWRPNGMIVVTHEPTDLLRLATRVFIMKDGRIIQDGRPNEVYKNPVNKYAAELLGPINEIRNNEAIELGFNAEADLLLRPNSFVVKRGNDFEVRSCEFVGPYYLMECYSSDWNKSILVQINEARQKGSRLNLKIDSK